LYFTTDEAFNLRFFTTASAVACFAIAAKRAHLALGFVVDLLLCAWHQQFF
jgi:hypothetical protein